MNDKHGPPDTNTHNYDSKTAVRNLYEGDSPLAWVTCIHSQRQRPKIHVEVVAGITPHAEITIADVYVIPPTDKQTNGVNEQINWPDLPCGTTP